MLSSISPVGEASRRQRWWLTATAHLLGSLTGGAVVGVLLGAAGRLVVAGTSVDLRLGVLALAAIVGVAVDLSGRPRVPSWRRQVDERWLTAYRGWVYGAGYGLQLGAGALTIVPATTTYVTGLAALLTGGWMAGGIVGATFGLVRAVPLLLTARTRTVASLTRMMRRVAEARRPARLLTSAGQSVVALAAALAVVGS